jgi:hypothetical protein
MGRTVPLGYRVRNRQLLVISSEADRVRYIFNRYLKLGSVLTLKTELDHDAKKSNPRNRAARSKRGSLLARGALYTILNNPIYVGRIRHKDQSYPGHHAPIIEPSLWEHVQRQLSTHRKNRRNRISEGSY